jgi:hypothetical protein
MVADTRGQDEVKETRMFQNWMKASSASIRTTLQKQRRKIYILFTESWKGSSLLDHTGAIAQ